MASVPVRQLTYERILVTGAGGFVGRHLIAGLRRSISPSARIIATDRTGLADAESVQFDLLDPVTVAHAVEKVKPDLVFHLAGQASVSDAAKDEAKTFRANAGGSLELALALKAHVPSADVIFASSAEIYGDAFLGGSVSEETEPKPGSVYGRSKLLAEQALDLALAPDSHLLVIRPSNHVGPGQDERFALPSFAAQIARAEAADRPAALRVGNLAACRDFLDVRDVADAYVAAAAALPRLAPRMTLNLSSGQPRSLQSLLEKLRELALVETFVEVDQERFRAAEIPVAAVQSHRIRSLIGWQQSHSIDETLASILTDARQRAARSTVSN